MEWLTISVNPPPLDIDLVARTKANPFGYGYSYKTFDKIDTASTMWSRKELEGHLTSAGFIEWARLDDEAEQYEREARADHLTSEQF